MLIGLTPTPKPKPAEAPAGQASAAIYDVTTADFETKVIQESVSRPVIIDFWAPWCGPCKQLGPILEAAVAAKGGKIALAKVDIDQNPEIAQAFRVQSIPMVVALYQGQPVTAFAGARPKADIDTLIDQLVKLQNQNNPEALDIPLALKDAALLLAENDLVGAQQIYAAILTQEEHNVEAYVGLVRILIAAVEYEDAQAMIANAPDLIKKSPVFAAAQTALDLARNAPTDDLSLLAQKAQDSPDDPEVQFTYAEACFAHGHKEEATTALVDLMRRNRAWEDDKARKQLLKYFEAWGNADPATVAGRKKLSAVLFS